MRDLNIDFMDLYKRVDNFIKDAYSSSTGISTYIEEMEINNYKGKISVYNWETTYCTLKHLRWIRNQLAHEVGYDSDICSENDYEQLDNFYDDLYNANDPLSLLHTPKKRESKSNCINSIFKSDNLYNHKDTQSSLNKDEKQVSESHFIRKLPKLPEKTNYNISANSSYNNLSFSSDDEQKNMIEEKSPSLLKRIIKFIFGK